MTGASGAWRRVLTGFLVIAVLSVSVTVALRFARPASGSFSSNIPPPPYGYFTLRPVGWYATMPSDAEAAAEVRRSTWEPRHANAPYNHTIPVRLKLQRERMPGYKHLPCPVTFGIVGTKSTSWPGIFPWNRTSTAAAVDVLGGWLRGCYEGWVWWLRDHGNRSRGVYHSGDIWGCVGAWYSGNWHDGPANGHGGESYSQRAYYWYKQRPWLRPRF